MQICWVSSTSQVFTSIFDNVSLTAFNVAITCPVPHVTPIGSRHLAVFLLRLWLKNDYEYRTRLLVEIGQTMKSMRTLKAYFYEKCKANSLDQWFPKWVLKPFRVLQGDRGIF